MALSGDESGKSGNAVILRHEGHHRPPMETLLKLLAAQLKSIATACVLAMALSYASLAVPGRVTAVCANLGTPIYCPVLAYGFPVPFLSDSQGISPVGSVARDPLSLLVGADELSGGRLSLTGLFWLLAVLTVKWLWRHWRHWRRKLHR